MDTALSYAIDLIGSIPTMMWIPIGFFAAIGVFAQYILYQKAGCNGIACMVPVWNVYEFMKIMGRPGWHSLFIMIPPPVIAIVALMDPTSMVNLSIAGALFLAMLAFVIKVYIELCQSFGKTTFLDYFLVIMFNGLYVLYLGMSPVKYKGPVYQRRTVKEAPAATAAV